MEHKQTTIGDMGKERTDFCVNCRKSIKIVEGVWLHAGSDMWCFPRKKLEDQSGHMPLRAEPAEGALMVFEERKARVLCKK